MAKVNDQHLKESFPVDGFSYDLRILPALTFGTIWRYMIKESEAKKQLSTAKTSRKGLYIFFLNQAMFFQ